MRFLFVKPCTGGQFNWYSWCVTGPKCEVMVWDERTGKRKHAIQRKVRLNTILCSTKFLPRCLKVYKSAILTSNHINKSADWMKERIMKSALIRHMHSLTQFSLVQMHSFRLIHYGTSNVFIIVFQQKCACILFTIIIGSYLIMPFIYMCYLECLHIKFSAFCMCLREKKQGGRENVS